MWQQLLQVCRLKPSATISAPELLLPENANLIVRPNDILYILNALCKSEAAVELRYSEQEQPVSSRILHVDHHRRELLIRQTWQERESHRPPAGDRFNLTARYRSSAIVLTTSVGSEVLWHDQLCFRAAIPDYLMSTEMRSYARIQPRSRVPIRASLPMPQGELLRCNVVDLSERGFRIRSGEHYAAPLKDSTELRQVKLELPRMALTDLAVHLRYFANSGSHIEAGFELTTVPEHADRLLRRYIMACSTNNR